MNENINKWKADFADWVDADTLNDGERCYIEARKKAQEEIDELKQHGLLYNISSQFKELKDNLDDADAKVEKRDKLLGIYSRMVAKYKSYLSEDDDEIIHEANKELQELK